MEAAQALSEEGLATKADINELKVAIAKIDTGQKIWFAVTFLAIIAPTIRDLIG